MSKKPWTTGEEREAVRLRTVERLTIPAIARRLDRTRGSVRCKLESLGVCQRVERRASGELMRAVKRLAGRKPDWEIGYILNVCREAVTQARNRLGLPPFDRKQSERRKAVSQLSSEVCS